MNLLLKKTEKKTIVGQKMMEKNKCICDAALCCFFSRIFDSSYVLSCGHDFKLAV